MPSVDFAALLLSGCGYNAMQAQDEQIKAAWAEVLNQYQRRADLVPNLVNVVKGYAAHEKEVLTQVTEARAQVGSIQATPELINDPAAFAQFQQAQAQMTSALSRLLAVSENYPTLKADGAFRDLQAQLEGTENRVTVARNRFLRSNVRAREFERHSPDAGAPPGLDLPPGGSFDPHPDIPSASNEPPVHDNQAPPSLPTQR